MMNLKAASALEASLRRGTIAGVSGALGAGSFLMPSYGGRSLANVPATAAGLLGVSAPGIQPPADVCYWGDLGAPVRRVVLMLVDALGYLYLRPMLDDSRAGIWRQLADACVFLPMTAICPSTTITSLATLMTGASPAEHGLLGYELWLRELGVLAEMLSLKPVYGAGQESLVSWGLDPARLLPVPTLAERLAAEGVASVGLVAGVHLDSPLSQALYRGAGRLVGYDDVGDLWQQLATLLETPPQRPELIMAYWGGLDTAIHLHGTRGGAWQAAWAAFTQAMARGLGTLSSRAREDTALIIMADHGFVDSPEDAAHDLDSDGGLRSACLVPPSGEARLAFLHTMGAQGLARLYERLEADFAMLDAPVALKAGLFGPGAPADETPARLGDLLAIARADHYLDRLDRRRRLRGRHGGLSPEEMLIPWLAVRLDA
jgi:hypothetical protein